MFNLAEQSHYRQVDFVKAVAIISVIFLHTLPPTLQAESYSDFYFGQAIPIFVILIGLTWYMAFIKRDAVYSKGYFKVKLVRFLFPFAIICLIDALYIAVTQVPANYILLLTLQLPTGGPGSYFVPLLLQLTIFTPLIFWSYKKKPVVTLTGMFLLDLAFEVTAPYLPYQVYYLVCLRYLATLAVGILIGDILTRTGKVALKIKALIPFGLLVGLSMVYLLSYQSSVYSFLRTEWRAQTLLSVFYSLAFTILLFRGHNLIMKSKATELLELVGKASYHIFLVQLLYFGTKVNLMLLIPGFPSVLSMIIVNLAVTILLGLFFYHLERKLFSLLNNSNYSSVGTGFVAA